MVNKYLNTPPTELADMLESGKYKGSERKEIEGALEAWRTIGEYARFLTSSEEGSMRRKAYAGSVKVYNSRDELIGWCLDHPEAIAKMFFEIPEASYIMDLDGKDIRHRKEYRKQIMKPMYMDSGFIKNRRRPGMFRRSRRERMSYRTKSPEKAREELLVAFARHKFAKDKFWIESALRLLIGNQTDYEKWRHVTIPKNLKGFNKKDAKNLKEAIAEYILLGYKYDRISSENKAYIEYNLEKYAAQLYRMFPDIRRLAEDEIVNPITRAGFKVDDDKLRYLGIIDSGLPRGDVLGDDPKFVTKEDVFKSPGGIIIPRRMARELKRIAMLLDPKNDTFINVHRLLFGGKRVEKTVREFYSEASKKGLFAEYDEWIDPPEILFDTRNEELIIRYPNDSTELVGVPSNQILD